MYYLRKLAYISYGEFTSDRKSYVAVILTVVSEFKD